MLDVSPTSSVQSNVGNQTISNATKSQVDYDVFLKLLVAEMQNQDPTKPMDSTQYISQLASFSNVEQGIQTNEKLDLLLNQSLLYSAGSLVGKTVTSRDGTVSGEVSKIRFNSGSGIAILADGRELPLGEGITVSK